MLKWFQKNEKQTLGFQDMQYAIHHSFVIINTLPAHMQDCLIVKTVPIDLEEKTMNDMIDRRMQTTSIVVYGLNSADLTAETKYHQLVQLGFCNVYLYVGGLFEWLLLQDIYGGGEFPTTKKVLDILKYQGKPRFWPPNGRPTVETP